MPLPKLDQSFLKARTKKFWDLYKVILDKAMAIAESRGSKYDDETPIYYRWTPEGLIHEIKKKAGRIEAMLKQEGWADNPTLLQGILQEQPDIVNFAGYLGAIVMMLSEGTTATYALDPEHAKVFVQGTSAPDECPICGNYVYDTMDWIRRESGIKHHRECWECTYGSVVVTPGVEVHTGG